MNALLHLQLGFIKIIRNGFQTDILQDPWPFYLPLNLKPTYINPSSILDGTGASVAAIIRSGSWDSQLLLDMFVNSLICHINSIEVAHSPCDDKWF